MELNNERGVTLVELLAVITLTAIIGIIGYNILFSGISTYDRVKIESALRDEADLIMATMIQELYTLKLSEIQDINFDEDSGDYYLTLDGNNRIGFIDNQPIIRNREINLSNNIYLTNETKIEEMQTGQYKITIALETTDSTQKLKTYSEISIIDDSRQGVENDEP